MPAGQGDDRPLPVGFRDRGGERPVTESLGEALLGSLLDRAHLLPPRLVGPMVAQEIAAVGGSDVSVHLQDYDQGHLHPLAGHGLVGERAPIGSSPEGTAFRTDEPVEEEQPGGGVRLHLPMLDGSDRVGVLSSTLPRLGSGDRRLAFRLAGLVADLVVTKSAYTDEFERARAARPLTLAARLQRDTLPPLAMTTPDIDLAGVLEPAYEVGGDSFDHAMDDHLLHVAVLEAVRGMNRIVAATFPGRFATAQLGRLDTRSGELGWVNAGHPAPLLVRGGTVVGELTGPITRPLGMGDGSAGVHTARLEPEDRVLFFTDGVVEERIGGEQFGEARLRELLEGTTREGLAARETVRRLSHALMAAGSGRTSDDASLLLVEWNGPPPDDELSPDIPEATPTDYGRG